MYDGGHDNDDGHDDNDDGDYGDDAGDDTDGDDNDDMMIATVMFWSYFDHFVVMVMRFSCFMLAY